jgi:serine/threonine protein kinase
MSPEQAAGRLDLLSPASDVYSLGATLYCLLTGQPPFTNSDVGALLGQVQRGEFAPPRERKEHIPRPLEAICLKAMALQM